MHSVWYVFGLEALSSTAEAAESRGSHVTRDGAFEVEFEFETATSLSRAFTASGDHHGLDMLSVWYVSGLEA